MAAAMNGMALHGGIVPYGGTFLVFSDYCRPSIRLSALMGKRVIYVMTHDSIGLGEDGPTHQPVEHLAALRAMPNLNVFRPADSIECAECWEIALSTEATPSILALTRQGLPLLRTAHTDENLTAKGAYVLVEPKGQRDVTLIATGSEVALAVTAAKELGEEGITAAVVSMPCWELFDAQDRAYQDEVLGARPASALRPRSSSAGGNGLDPTAISSACADLGLLLRPRSFISISESRWRPSRLPPSMSLANHNKRGEMSNKRVAINGFGRIGRLTLRAFLESGRKDLDFVAINDLGSAEMNAHLLGLRQRAWPLPRQDHRRQRPSQGRRPRMRRDVGSEPREASLARSRRRHRHGMHRPVHRPRRRRQAPDRRRQARARVRALQQAPI